MKEEKIIKKKILIVGGGVAGLAAGIYGQMNGFVTEVHEKHSVVGGQCTGWRRKGYLIDNCVHWLTGTNNNKEIYHVWCDVGVLGDDVEVIQHQSFMEIEKDGEKLNVWYDTERWRREMIKISPEDEQEINTFIRNVNAFREMMIPARKPSEMLSIWDKVKLLYGMRHLGPVYKKYSKISVEEYAERFKHPLLKKMITIYIPDCYNMSSLLYVFGTFVDGNGALPRGGSLGIVERMVKRYEELGGKIVVNHEAEKIDIEGFMAKRVRFKNGDVEEGDYVVCACDTSVTFNRLIGRGLMDKFFERHYNRKKEHPLYSSLNCYFGLDGQCADRMAITTSFDCEPWEVNGRKIEDVFVKHFDYEPSFAPKGKSILQTMTVQYEGDFDYWEKLYNSDRESYKREKERISEEIKRRLEEKWDWMKGKLEVLDVVTPMSYFRFCSAYKGAYMSFILSKFAPKEIHPGRVLGVKNLYLAGQWLQPPGGLPNAVVTGKFAIQRIMKN